MTNKRYRITVKKALRVGDALFTAREAFQTTKTAAYISKVEKREALYVSHAEILKIRGCLTIALRLLGEAEQGGTAEAQSE